MANRVVSVILRAEVDQFTSGMRRAAGATGGLQRSMGLAGKGSLLMGGAIATGIGMAVSKSMEFEKAMSAVQAATGGTASTLGQLRAVAIKAGADTMYSATEAANGITEMAKAGVSAKDIMGGGLTGALSLAAAGQIDVAEAAGVASTAMTQFSLSGKDIPHVADLLAAGAGKAMGSVDDLGMALNQAGLVASASGLSIEETTGTLAAFASAGLLGSDAGTSLKVMLQKLQAPSIQASGVMKQYGINVYDTNGNMLDMAGMAGQLKDHLGGLTQEQRNSALATIFGSDAVRAANVLYSQGADGIAAWTSKVNDQGYAQKQAAELTDNLSGDIERLGGSFDTLMISLGSGAQGPLRSLVGALTGILNVAGSAADAFGKIPGPVQAAVVGFGLLVALRGPLDAMFTRLALATVSSVTGLGMATGATGAFSLALGAARIAVTRLVTAAAPLAAMVALGYAIADVVKFTNAGDDARGTVDALHESLKNLGNAASLDTASKGIDDLRKKIADAQALIDAANSESFIHHTFVGQFSGIDGDAHKAALSVKEYKAALAELEGQQTRTNATADALAKGMGVSRDEVIRLADKYKINLADGVNSARLQFAEFDAGQTASANTIAATTPSRDVLMSQLGDISNAADDAKKSTDLFKMSLDILTGKTIDTATVEAAFYEAVSKSDGAMKGLHGSVLTATGSLNVQSEAGRKAQGVLFDIRDANNQVIATMIQNGATTAQVTAKDAELRGSFIKSAMQMGISRTAAEKLANQILGIPKDRNTKITADTRAAAGAIDGLQKKINGITGKTVFINAEYATNGAVRRVGNAVAAFADGGYTGHGGKYEPKGVVHGGEFVFTKEQTAAAGVGTLAAYAKSLKGYAGGGHVPVNVDFTPAYNAVHRMVASLGAPGPGGSVERWRGIVLQVLSLLGRSPSLANGILQMIKAESGGNPRAINLVDSNARAGHPSQGLMQTIPSTFYAYAGPYAGRGITDPLANIYAGVNYALNRYSTSMVAAGGRHARGGAYVGYLNGVDSVPHDDLYRLHSGERVMTREENVTYTRSREMSGRSGGGAGAGSMTMPAPIVKVYLDGEEWRGMARVEAEGAVVDYATAVDHRGRY